MKIRDISVIAPGVEAVQLKEMFVTREPIVREARSMDRSCLKDVWRGEEGVIKGSRVVKERVGFMKGEEAQGQSTWKCSTLSVFRN